MWHSRWCQWSHHHCGSGLIFDRYTDNIDVYGHGGMKFVCLLSTIAATAVVRPILTVHMWFRRSRLSLSSTILSGVLLVLQQRQVRSHSMSPAHHRFVHQRFVACTGARHPHFDSKNIYKSARFYQEVSDIGESAVDLVQSHWSLVVCWIGLRDRPKI